jgi:hypothetical protein
MAPDKGFQKHTYAENAGTRGSELVDRAEWGLCKKLGTVLAGVHLTCDDVVTRWIGQQKTDLYYELGPPQFHKEAQDSTEE